MTDDANTFVWLNGSLQPAARARIDPADRGLLLGDGLFETIRVTSGIPRHIHLHLKRLRQGAAQLGIEVAPADAEIIAACAEILNANKLDEAALRITLTRGIGARGISPPLNAKPTLLITATALAGAPKYLTAIISRRTRRNEFSLLAAIKSLNYLDNIIARREANERGADDAILLNTQGNIAESTAANLFLLKAGQWLTPRVKDGALPGIFRARLLALDTVHEAKITEADLFSSDSICLGNALSLRIVTKLEGLSINTNLDASDKLRDILLADD